MPSRQLSFNSAAHINQFQLIYLNWLSKAIFDFMAQNGAEQSATNNAVSNKPEKIEVKGVNWKTLHLPVKKKHAAINGNDGDNDAKYCSIVASVDYPG